MTLRVAIAIAGAFQCHSQSSAFESFLTLAAKPISPYPSVPTGIVWESVRLHRRTICFVQDSHRVLPPGRPLSKCLRVPRARLQSVRHE